MPSYGLVVEGSFDGAIYDALVHRLMPVDTEVLIRDMGGVSQLVRSFPIMLRDLEKARDGQPVDKVLVLRDADGRDVGVLEQALRTRIRGQAFAFPRDVDFSIAVQMVETWLLADVPAINTVALRRQGLELAAPVELPDELETIPNPKQLLTRLLFRAGIPHTPPVCAEIAQTADLEVVRARCRSFRLFEEKLRR